MERRAFAVERVLREAVKYREADEQRSELGVIDHLEMKLLFGATHGESQVDRDHRRRSAEFAGDCGEMVARNSADGAAHVDDFGGSELGRERGDDFRASHGELDVAKAQKGMAAKIYLVCADRGDRARGTNRRVALHQDHACHVAR